MLDRGDKTGGDAREVALPLGRRHLGAQEPHAHLHELVPQVHEDDIIPILCDDVVEDDGSLLLGDG